ncbi:MAG: molybdenum cofactor guanylyltransferase [Ilumatobacteraceae bacterium]
MTSVPIGAVLCGGASRGMGTDRATILVAGVPLARRVADALVAAGCGRIVAIGGDASDLGDLGLEPVEDEFPGEGPLGGVLTSLTLGSPAVVVACDLPNLRPQTVAELIMALGDHDAAMAHNDRIEPLCAVWSASAATQLRARFDAGERAMHRAVEGLDIAWVPVAAAELRNINTRDDLESL